MSKIKLDFKQKNLEKKADEIVFGVNQGELKLNLNNLFRP